jgi:hypothetical protein
VEHTHDEVENELGGGHVPSQRFGVNSTWFKIALLTYNMVSAIKGLCLEGADQLRWLKAGGFFTQRKPIWPWRSLAKQVSV